MKKSTLHLTMITAASAAALVFIMAMVTSETFASTFTFKDVPQGKSYDAFFGELPDYDVTAYYKIKPTKKGYITFTADYSGTVVLCNSQKKVISKGSGSGDPLYPNASASYLKKVSYGVAKGKTYYIRVKGMPNYDSTDANYWAKVKLTNSGIAPSKCGSSKAKAKAIKRKKTVKGLFVAGSKKAQWFKITTKQKTTTILLRAPKTNDEINMTVYYKEHITKGKLVHSTKMSAYRSGNTLKYTLTQIGAKKKYAAYVKITRANKTSGSYTLKWK